MTKFEEELTEAVKYLGKHDDILKPIIEANGLPTLRPHSDYYGALVNSIIGQQLSVKAAAAIKRRFTDLFGGKYPAPEQILTKSVEDLRAIGFSNAKGRYVRDLAQHVIDGSLKFDKLDSQANQEIIAELTAVKGIGEWTAHMFLMFSMGRLDVLPVGDLGIKNGIRKLYGLADAPTAAQITELAKKNHWHPYESIASWYVWRSLENVPDL
jgi:DNA-3-methyladenine glycosylase II